MIQQPGVGGSDCAPKGFGLRGLLGTRPLADARGEVVARLAARGYGRDRANELGLFITGTDTGVGKTTIAIALLQAARARGLRTAAMKPIETGCHRHANRLHAQDAYLLSHSATEAGRWVCPYSLEAPLAPSIAAHRQGIRIDLETIEHARRACLERDPDLLIAEGAGGLLVPIGDERTIADVAVLFGYPIIIVARDRLGAINHALLTIEAARKRGLTIGGVVLNADRSDGGSYGNAEAIRAASGVKILGRFPWLENTQILKVNVGMIAERELQLEGVIPSRTPPTYRR